MKVEGLNSVPKPPSTLQKLSKDDLQKRDVFGRTILHLLILCNRSDLLRHLLKNPDIKSIINKPDYENGWNCLHYTIFLKRIQCYKILLDYLKNLNPNGNLLVLANNTVLFELIRHKDRNRNTPLQLLDNDFKDLIWVPEFVTEDDKVSLRYRFDLPDAGRVVVPRGSPEPEGSYSDPGTGAGAGAGAGPGTGTSPATTVKFRSLNDRHNWWDPKRSGSDVYMFGSNLNNTLGLGDSTDRQIPSKLPDSFFNNDTDILSSSRYKSVKLSKNHSVILTKDGCLFSCGIGSRGRLGHGFSEMNNSYRFKRIKFFDASEQMDSFKGKKTVKDFSISNDHSIALTTDNEIYAWGLNNFNQLAASSANSAKDFSDPFESVPKLVFSGDLKKDFSLIRGVSVSKIHSLVYTKHEIFSWGLNIGQMGFAVNQNNLIEYKCNGILFKGSIQHLPRKITLRDEIKLVQTCESCTCVVTAANDIHLYLHGQHVKLPKIPVKGSLDRNFHLFSPVKLTKAASVSKVCMKSPENIILLLDNGDILGFSVYVTETPESVGKLSKGIKYNTLWKSHDRDLKVADCDISVDASIVLTTASGLVFMKHSATGNKVRKNSMSETSLPIPVKNKFRRLDYLNKVVRVSCDDNFASFGFIRDDIDLIPLKLTSNTFIKDMEYMSCLTNADLYRKQNQLFVSDSPSDCYVSNYLYPKKFEESSQDFYESEEEDVMEEEEETLKLDSWFSAYVNKYDSSKNKRCKTRFTYQQIFSKEIDQAKESLKMFNGSDLTHVICNEEKHYDCFIAFKQCPEVTIGFHKNVFLVRSPFFQRLFNATEDERFVSDDVTGHFTNNTLYFDSDVDIKSVLILVHFLYTNRIILVWDDYPTGIHCPADIKRVKDGFEKLGKLFQVIDVFGTFTKDEVFFRNMRSLYELDSKDGDLIVQLADNQQVRCSSGILSARSAFFETTLSERWSNLSEPDNVLDFNKVEPYQFELVLKHLYGYSDFVIFDGLKSHCNDKDEFISSVLQIIQIADELLLFQLKNLCQLAIKDLVASDNVITLLVHSDDLNAPKLFWNCCWYIYNNLETLLLDQSFLGLSNEVLFKLEANVRLFNSCKLQEFQNGEMELSWMAKQSTGLINAFLYNMEEFNEHFMSDAKGFSSFEPLFDVKIDQIKTGEKRSRKNSRKSSVHHDIKQDILELRRAHMAAANRGATEPSNIDPITHRDESAIENDEEFEVVTRRRKQKSVGFESDKSPSPVSTGPSGSLKAPSVSLKAPSVSLSRNPSLTEISPTDVPKKSDGIRKMSNGMGLSPIGKIETPFNGLSPHSNWATKSTGSSILSDKSNIPQSQPVLGKSGDTDWSRKSGKLKMGPTVKLSQKERKKLASQTTEPLREAAPQPLVWGGTNGSTSSIEDPTSVSSSNAPKNGPGSQRKSPNDQKVNQTLPKVNQNLPVLGHNHNHHKSNQPKLNSKPTRRPSDTPANLTLTDIMLQESLKIEQAEEQERQRKTLLEIQQEQEFAKWWEEETARVQQQMQQYDLGSKSSSKGQKKRRPSKKKN